MKLRFFCPKCVLQRGKFEAVREFPFYRTSRYAEHTTYLFFLTNLIVIGNILSTHRSSSNILLFNYRTRDFSDHPKMKAFERIVAQSRHKTSGNVVELNLGPR